jgi:hypothetical protein
MASEALFNEYVAQIAREANVAPDNVEFAISHAHNSIRVDTQGVGKTIPYSLAFNAGLKDKISKSISEANAALQPARIGYGRGKSFLAANRNRWDEKEQRYLVAVDRTGREPFDPTVAVVRFDDLQGVPLAFLINYGFEPVINNNSRAEISGDLPGATARYVETHYADKAVAAFTVAAVGNPAYSAGEGRRSPGRVPSSAHDLLSAMATLLGEEVLVVSDEIHNQSDSVSVASAQKIVQCPGKITTPINLGNSCAYSPDSKLPPCRDYKDQETAPVNLRIGLLRIGDMAIVQSDSNVAPALGLKLTDRSPLSNTFITATNFGSGWFIADDAAYPQFTYEATASRFRKGCAEPTFINTALELIRQTNPH